MVVNERVVGVSLLKRTCKCYAVDTLADDGCHYHGDIREEKRSC